MSQIKGRLARLSKRTKFKDPDTIEIVILDHESQEEYSILWQFRISAVSQKSAKKEIKVVSEEEIHD